MIQVWLRLFLWGWVMTSGSKILAMTPQDANLQQIDLFFDSLEVPELRLQIDRRSQDRLRETPREYARCLLIENGTEEYRAVGIKLKGAAGSYRDFDDRPGLTLNMDKSIKDQRFHGMEKFHLNNAVQDETWLNEWLGSEIFRAVGIAAPRVGHVRLWINDRDMGLYVLREGFDRPFFQRSFNDRNGSLYDGGFGNDVDSPLEKDSGGDPDDRQDLIALAVACHERSPATRWQRIEEHIDLDRFLTFMAVERILGHWDGYTQSANNYRLYFPGKGKGNGQFLPHGMDQLLGDPWSGLYDQNHVLLSAAVMQRDRWRLSYRDRLLELVERLSPVEPWIQKLESQRAKIRAVLEKIDPELAEQHSQRVKELEYRWVQRMKVLPELIEHQMPRAVEFQGRDPSLHLIDWFPAQESDAAKLEESELDGVSTYLIECQRFEDVVGSWRHPVLLRRGKYRLDCRVQHEDIIPHPDDRGSGVSVRIHRSISTNCMKGTSNDWQETELEFEVLEDQRMVELILELRARHGRVWFDRDSLRLHRLSSP